MVAWLMLAALAVPEVWTEPLLTFPPPETRSDAASETVSIDTARGESASALVVFQADEALTGVYVDAAPPHESLTAPEVFVAQSDGTLEPVEKFDVSERGRVLLLLRFTAPADARPGFYEDKFYIRADGLRRSRKLSLTWRVREAVLQRSMVPPLYAGIDLDQLPAESAERAAALAAVAEYPFDYYALRGRYAASPEDAVSLIEALPGAGGRPALIGPVFPSVDERGLLHRQALEQGAAWAAHLGDAYWNAGVRVLVDTPDADDAAAQAGRVVAEIPNSIAVVSGSWYAASPSIEERAAPWDARLLSPGGASVIEMLPVCGGAPATVQSLLGSPGLPVPGMPGTASEAAWAGDCCPATGWSPQPGGGAWLAWDFTAPIRLERLRIVGLFGMDIKPPEVYTAYTGQPYTSSTVTWTAPRPGVLDGVFKYPAEFAALRLDFLPPADAPVVITELIWQECGESSTDRSGVWLTPPGGPFATSAPEGTKLTAAGWGILADHVRGIIMPAPGIQEGTAQATMAGEYLRDALEDDALLFGLGSGAADLAHEFATHAAKQLRGEPGEEWPKRAEELRETLRRRLDN